MKIIIYGKHSKDWNEALNNIEMLNELDNFFKNDGKILIPLMEKHSIEIIKLNLEKFAFIPNLGEIIILKNKCSFSNFLKQNKLDIYSPFNYDKNDDYSYPVIVKLNDSNYGNGSYICNKKEDFIERDNIVIQKYIQSNYEYTSNIIFKNGIRHILTYKYTFEKNNYIRNARTHPTKTEKIKLENKYEEIFLLILEKLKYKGVCNIDFKITNKIYIFEINPRFGGSLMLKENKKDLTDFLKSYINCYLEN